MYPVKVTYDSHNPQKSTICLLYTSDAADE